MGGHMHDSCDLQGIRNEHLFALKLWGGSTTIGSKFLVVAVAKFPEFHPSCPNINRDSLKICYPIRSIGLSSFSQMATTRPIHRFQTHLYLFFFFFFLYIILYIIYYIIIYYIIIIVITIVIHWWSPFLMHIFTRFHGIFSPFFMATPPWDKPQAGEVYVPSRCHLADPPMVMQLVAGRKMVIHQWIQGTPFSDKLMYCNDNVHIYIYVYVYVYICMYTYICIYLSIDNWYM